MVGVDRSLVRLTRLLETYRASLGSQCYRPISAGKIDVLCFDCSTGTWPFMPAVFGGAVMVDFYSRDIIPHVAESMMPGAILFIETPKGHGRNHLSLPLRGSVKAALAPWFDLMSYLERHAGPKISETVSVVALACRR